jgi:hypothetical protein
MTANADDIGADPGAGGPTMTDSSAENPALPVVSSEPRASEPSGAAARPPTEPKTYRNRFLAVYAVLGLTLVGAIVGAVVLILQNGPLAAPAWSSWKPASGSTAKMTSAIADHVARQYKLNGRGSQLVAVVAGAPKVTSGTKDVKISAIAVRKKPQSNAGIQVFPSNQTWTYQFCGLGAACSIASGQASSTRGRLVRREALEVALDTFKFVPSVDSIVAFMPPPPGQTTTTLLYLQKSNLKEQLSQPLSKTLTLPRPPLPTDPDTSETATIDRLTLPAVYSYQLTQLQDGSAALILDPVAQ